MRMFIELWHPTPAWQALTPQARRDYLAEVGPHIEAAAAAGLGVIGWGAVDRSVPHAPDLGFVGVYRLDGALDAAGLEHAVAQSGWYRFFRCTNIACDVEAPGEAGAQQIFERLLGL